MDRNLPVHPEITNWNETRWLGTWNPDAGVGFYLHAGRFRHDLDLWWAQTVVYLPGGLVGVDRSWGRDRDERGVRTGVFDLLVEEPGKLIRSSFDGAMELCTTEQLARYPRGAGGNSVPVRWNLEAEAIRPMWSIYDQHGTEQEWATGSHTEQHHTVRGELTVGSVSSAATYSLDGWGFDDHSSGVREFDGFGSHIFFDAPVGDHAAGGLGLHMIAMQDVEGRPTHLVGAVTRAGADPDPITEVAVPLIGDLLGAPHTLHASVGTRSGQRVELDIEVLHTCPMTITTDHNDNINGLDWDVPGSPLFFTECIARYTTADGQVGYGHLERSARRERFDRDTLAVRDPRAL